MLKLLSIATVGAVCGVMLGWFVHQSRYGRDAEFGPFSSASDVTASTVANVLKEKTQAGSPRIEVIGGEEYDFGVMEPGSKGKHKFQVRNVGEFPLSLEIVGSTCKCTIGELTKSSIAAGEQTDIELTWDVKSSGEDFGQSAILKTNDPARGELHLKIKGRVISQMTMVPRSFGFGEVESGSPIKLESVVYSFEKEPIVPVVQKFSDDLITQLASFTVTELPMADVKDEAYATATQAFNVAGEIKPGMQQGSVQQNFMFGFVPKSSLDAGGKHKDEDVRYFLVPFAGRIVGAITMVESSKCQGLEGGGYVFSIPRGDPATAKPERANIMLRGKHKDTLTLSVGEVEPADLLRAELDESVGRGSVKLYPLRLWIDPAATAGSRTGKSDDDYGVVWIRTDNPEVSPLRLRVRFAVEK